MKIESTIPEIRALLQLAELDAQARGLPPEAFDSLRKATRRQVAGALVERYEALLEAGRSPVIVPIERASCSGCHLRLPTMVTSRARRVAAVYLCPHCRRMLYAPELLALEDSGAPQRALTPQPPKADP